jgi:hypothetical protein
MFTSDEEALAAARETYEAFLAASDAVLADGGTGIDRIDMYAGPAVVATEHAGFERFSRDALRLTGATKVVAFELQSQRSSGGSAQEITAYACIDVANVDVIDASGNSVVSDARPDLTPFEVAFSAARGSPTGLIVTSNLVWTGAGVC